MIQNVLSNINGVGLYGVISICIFIAVFAGVLVWMLRLKSPYLDAMRRLPLHDDAPNEPAVEPQAQSKVTHE